MADRNAMNPQPPDQPQQPGWQPARGGPPSGGNPYPQPVAGYQQRTSQAWPPGPPTPKKRRVWPWVVGASVLLLIIIGSIAKPAAPTTTAPSQAAGAETPAAAVPTSLAAPTQSPVVAAAPPVAAATSWTMPNLVGHNLQDAQDAIQALTSDAIFVTKSHDVTGAGRHQILDRDWTVCSQNVKPGAKITAGTAIDFGAAKIGEHC